MQDESIAVCSQLNAGRKYCRLLPGSIPVKQGRVRGNKNIFKVGLGQPLIRVPYLP